MSDQENKPSQTPDGEDEQLFPPEVQAKLEALEQRHRALRAETVGTASGFTSQEVLAIVAQAGLHVREKHLESGATACLLAYGLWVFGLAFRMGLDAGALSDIPMPVLDPKKLN